MAMQFLKGLTRWFHFGRTPTTIESGKPIQEVPAEPQQLVTRRNLLFGLGATAIVAAIPEIPFGRVWSFPHDLVRVPVYGSAGGLATDWQWVSAQSVALQLEKVRHNLPLLYERDTKLFKLISRVEPVSARSMRIPISDFDDGALPRGAGTVYDYDDFDFDASRYSAAWEQRARRNGEFWREQLVPIPPAGDDCVVIPNPKTEAGKVSRLVDRYGDTLADKVDRTVVKPVRDELESICDLVNNA